ncbi:MAG: zinc ribbon domain-containing protein [Planctomycetes bacterium]|nr:zinc ribbon domain-containing protein [Planctomycetota bacterium]
MGRAVLPGKAMRTGVDHLVPEQPCSGCGRLNRGTARYCATCGTALALIGLPQGRPGRTPHPHPLPSPAGFEACLDACDLHVQWRQGEGSALGVEPVTVDVFNAGYDLRSVSLRMVGVDSTGRMLRGVEQTIVELPRGATLRIEVPTYEVSEEISRLIVSLASAE